MNAIQLEFSGRGSYILAMLAHGSTCETELKWTDWLREAKAVARGYPDAPGGQELGKLGIIRDQICANKFPETLAARVARKKKEAAWGQTVGAARSRSGTADAQPARRAVSARRPHFADDQSARRDGAQSAVEATTRMPGTPVSRMLQSGQLLKRRLASARSPRPGEPLSPPRRRPSPKRRYNPAASWSQPRSSILCMFRTLAAESG